MTDEPLKQGIKSALDWCLVNDVDVPVGLIAAYQDATKDYDFFLRVLERMIRNLYNGLLGGEFVEILNNLIVGQIAQAYETAWLEAGNELPVPEYLRDAAQADILQQQGYVQQLFRDVIDARVDGDSLESVQHRASLWANRYNESYNNAQSIIAGEAGGKLIWRLGATEDHCETCSQLNGHVAYATEWQASGLRPQNAPNALLECAGWNCGCSLEPTEQRRSPDAMGTLINIATAMHI